MTDPTIAAAAGPSWEVIAVGACTVISTLAVSFAGLIWYVFGETKREAREGIEGNKLQTSTLQSRLDAAQRDLMALAISRAEHDGRLKMVEQSVARAVSTDVFNERSDRQDEMLRMTAEGMKDIKRRLSPGTMQAARTPSDPPMPRPRLPSVRSGDGE